jgi:hypothetical protein
MQLKKANICGKLHSPAAHHKSFGDAARERAEEKSLVHGNKVVFIMQIHVITLYVISQIMHIM